MQRILLIDNYDSFTFNLVQLLKESEIPHELIIVTNDIEPENLPHPFDKVLISPGPGLPHEANNLMRLIACFADTHPILGVCLGHQALALHFGCHLKQLKHSAHGVHSKITLTNHNDLLFNGLNKEIQCGRYHSWVIDPQQLTKEIIVTATDSDDNIMAFRHATKDIWGVQFHPESYITEHGNVMIKNWLSE